MSDKEVDGEFEPQSSLVEAVASGDSRESLVALRDYVAHELEGNRCSKCRASQLRTGDTAALVLRLQKIIEDIQALPADKKDAPVEGENVRSLDAIRSRRGNHSPDREPVADVGDDSVLSSRSAPRKQAGRKPRFRSG